MKKKMPIRVLIVDDHPVVRAGLKALINEVDDLEVIGEAGDGESALERYAELQPDVVLMDLMMPHIDGVASTRRIKLADPHARVLAVSSFTADEVIFPALRNGACGYVLKSSDPQQLLDAIRFAARGESFLDPVIARRVLEEMHTPHGEVPSELTQREIDVLRLVATGLTNEQIGGKLFLSPATVRTHVSNILGKLHIANRVQAALYALKTGIAEL